MDNFPGGNSSNDRKASVDTYTKAIHRRSLSDSSKELGLNLEHAAVGDNVTFSTVRPTNNDEVIRRHKVKMLWH